MRIISKDDSSAPADAAAATDIPPVKPADAPVPARTAMAAPRPAPELTPIIWGSARGFLKMACS